MWKDENGVPYEKGVSMIEISIDKDSDDYGSLTVEFKFESDLK